MFNRHTFPERLVIHCYLISHKIFIYHMFFTNFSFHHQAFSIYAYHFEKTSGFHKMKFTTSKINGLKDNRAIKVIKIIERKVPVQNKSKFSIWTVRKSYFSQSNRLWHCFFFICTCFHRQVIVLRKKIN